MKNDLILRQSNFNEKEIFKSVKDYEDLYEISNFGNVLSLNVTGVNSSSTALKINTVGGGLAMDITGMVAFRNGFNYSCCDFFSWSLYY